MVSIYRFPFKKGRSFELRVSPKPRLQTRRKKEDLGYHGGGGSGIGLGDLGFRASECCGP